jgi:hypothetical protein
MLHKACSKNQNKNKMDTFLYYGKTVRFVDSSLFVDGSFIGDFKGLKEAKEHLLSMKISKELKEELVVEKTPILEEDVIIALRESGEQRVTESLVHGIKRIVEEKKFFPSDVVLKLRESSIDTRFTSKIDYTLSDGSTVYIDIETNKVINNILDLRESADLLKFMNSNSKNFIRCVQDLLEDN